MTTPATQLKLGLFAIAAVIAAVAIALALGLHARTPTVRYHTYIDESVYGLEVGSSVTFRGVHVGNVSAIAIAADRRHIDVSLDLVTAQLAALDITAIDAQLERAGITGVKYVNLEPRTDEPPPDQLAFVGDSHVIVARRSTLSLLGDRADRLARSSTDLFEHTTAAIDSVTALVNEFRGEHVAARVSGLLEHADTAIGDVHRLASGVDGAALSAKANAALGHIDGAAAKLRDVLGRLDLGDDVSQTIRDLGDAARSFRDFVDELEREPDILIKGRSRSGP
ncbi:MAG TPA: MlaD family protein [Kofleriaceae bacterium]